MGVPDPGRRRGGGRPRWRGAGADRFGLGSWGPRPPSEIEGCPDGHGRGAGGRGPAKVGTSTGRGCCRPATGGRRPASWSRFGLLLCSGEEVDFVGGDDGAEVAGGRVVGPGRACGG